MASLADGAEWEYAARGGFVEELQICGLERVGQVSVVGDNSGRMTQPVGTKAPNGLGLYDMSGNVFEWCWTDMGDNVNQQTTGGPPRVRACTSWRLLVQ
jgi:formylglycine-generating enzyme required for sulfatase activity